jgi:hypothetical protein
MTAAMIVFLLRWQLQWYIFYWDDSCDDSLFTKTTAAMIVFLLWRQLQCIFYKNCHFQNFFSSKSVSTTTAKLSGENAHFSYSCKGSFF